jgi:putative two-component system response regulator
MSAKRKEKIILIDDNMANLTIAQNMIKDHYEVYALPSAIKLFKVMEHVIPDLILLDIEMPDINGYDVIRILKADNRYSDIPVIFVTARSVETDELKGLELGAVDYVTKPFSAAILLKRIETHLSIQENKAELKNANDKLKDFNENLLKMVTEKTQRIIELQNSIICIIADIVEFRDDVTGGHISRTQKYMQLILEQLIADSVYSEIILSWENMESLIMSSQLHDVGKISISDAILKKPGKLTPGEFEIMKTHTKIGVEIIQKTERKRGLNNFLKHAAIIAGTHHEKWDGSGYPYGLVKQEIPLEGRIMAIADVYDALISARTYKKPLTTDESARIIIESAGTHFDPELVKAFTKLTNKLALIAGEVQMQNVSTDELTEISSN